MMERFLILKLQGPMQAWGGHTFEGLRPSENLPTKSAVSGLLGACLGITRNDRQNLKLLIESIYLAVRRDQDHFHAEKITDYHTILDARMEYEGLKSHANSIQTWREYLCDAAFTLAIWQSNNRVMTMDRIIDALKKPYFTPYLGRRACPITRPLIESVVQAADFREALSKIPPTGGVIYSDVEAGNGRPLIFRDNPLPGQPRQFGNRTVYSYSGGDHVPE